MNIESPAKRDWTVLVHQGHRDYKEDILDRKVIRPFSGDYYLVEPVDTVEGRQNEPEQLALKISLIVTLLARILPYKQQTFNSRRLGLRHFNNPIGGKMKNNNDTLKRGLSIIRVVPALIVLSELSSSLGFGLAEYIPALALALFLAGQIMCWVGHPDGEKAWLLASVVSLVLGIGILFVPLFGQFISPLLLLLSFSFFLLYLRVLARSSNSESLAKRFLGLTVVAPVTLVVMVGSLMLVPAELYMLVGLSGAVIGLVFVISFSGATGHLVSEL